MQVKAIEMNLTKLTKESIEEMKFKSKVACKDLLNLNPAIWISKPKTCENSSLIVIPPNTKQALDNPPFDIATIKDPGKYVRDLDNAPNIVFTAGLATMEDRIMKNYLNLSKSTVSFNEGDYVLMPNYRYSVVSEITVVSRYKLEDTNYPWHYVR